MLPVLSSHFTFTLFVLSILITFCRSRSRLHAFGGGNVCANLIVTRGQNTSNISIVHNNFAIPEDYKVPDYNISKIELMDPKTVVRICGNLYQNCTVLDKSGDILSHRITTTTVSIITCSKREVDCVPPEGSCDSLAPLQPDWDDNECARLYSDDNCNSCTFPVDSLPKYGIKSMQFKGSIRIRNGCKVYGEYLQSDNSPGSLLLVNGNIPTNFKNFTCECGDSFKSSKAS